MVALVTALALVSVPSIQGPATTDFPTPLNHVPGAPVHRGFVLEDVDLDGHLDVVLCAGWSSTSPGVYVARGLGGEALEPAVRYPTISVPTAIAVADVDGIDGRDIVVTRPTGYSVLLEQGDGTFSEAFSSPMGGHWTSVDVGDIDGDGIVDLLCASDDNVPQHAHVAYGLGGGAFGPFVGYGLGGNLREAQLVDVDGDRRLDMLALARVSGVERIAVRRNLGGTSFAGPTYTVTTNWARALELADFDGDGVLDAAVLTPNDTFGPKCVSIQLGLGDGTFGGATSYGIGGWGRAMSIVDFDRDGLLDVLAWSAEDHTYTFVNSRLTLLRGIGGGKLQIEHGAPGLGDITGLAAGDLDLDGDIELVFCGQTVYGEAEFGVLRATPGEFVHLGREVATDFLYAALGTGDFNDDDRADLLVGRDGTIEVLHGAPQDQFMPVQSLTNPSNHFAAEMVVEDVSGNGHEDVVALVRSLAIPEGSIEVYTGRADGSFERVPPFPDNSPAVDFALGDLDGDGEKDLVIAALTEPNLRYHLHASGTQFGAGVEIPVESYSFIIRAADLDHDGLADIVTHTIDGFAIHPNLGSGQFASPVIVAGAPGQFVVADADGDGKLDLASEVYLGNNSFGVRIWPGRGDFTFGPTTTLAPTHPVAILRIVVDDIDGDGHTDVATASGVFELFRGLGRGQFAPPQRTWCGGGMMHPLVADMDDDGAKDLIVHGYWSEVVRVITQRRTR